MVLTVDTYTGYVALLTSTRVVFVMRYVYVYRLTRSTLYTMRLRVIT